MLCSGNLKSVSDGYILDVKHKVLFVNLRKILYAYVCNK